MFLLWDIWKIASEMQYQVALKAITCTTNQQSKKVDYAKFTKLQKQIIAS